MSGKFSQNTYWLPIMCQCILKMGKIVPITVQVNMFIHQTLGYSNIESYFMRNGICLFKDFIHFIRAMVH